MAGLPLVEAFTLLDLTKSKIENIPGEKGNRLREKFVAFLTRNPDVEVLRSANAILQEDGDRNILPEGMEPADVANQCGRGEEFPRLQKCVG